MYDTHTISFPGLGIPEFTVNETAFTVFGMQIKWYGVILTVGILSALFLFFYNARKREGLPEDHLYNVALFTVPIAIIGARVVYVATRWDIYRGDFLKMLNIREGGLAIYGGIIFGALTVLVYSKVCKLSFLKIADAVAPAVMLGQAIGRWGNFCNGEAFGSSAHVETLFCRMMVDGRATHPTFLYESLWNAVGLVLLLFVFYRRKKFDGEIFFLYIGWYGFGRTFIELLRTDSLYLFGNVKFSVVVGICSVILSVVGMFVLSRREKHLRAEPTYTAKFRAASVEAVPDERLAEEVAAEDAENAENAENAEESAAEKSAAEPAEEEPAAEPTEESPSDETPPQE